MVTDRDRGTLALIPGGLRVMIVMGRIVATRTNIVLDEQITSIAQGQIFSRGCTNGQYLPVFPGVDPSNNFSDIYLMIN